MSRHLHTRITIFCLLFGSMLQQTKADEIAERTKANQEVVSSFDQQNFAKLDKLSEKYRIEKTRTTSGLWYSTLFNAAIWSIADSRINNPDFWQKIESRAQKWTKQSPQSPAAHLSYAAFLIRHGWMYRGTGYAKDIPKENWPYFEHYISMARSYLEDHANVAKRDMNWYVLMAEVANAQSWPRDKFDKLIDEGLRREPSYYQLYFQAINYLIPIWHGNKEEIEKFANDSASRSRATEGFGMYARIYWYASQRYYGNELFTGSNAVWVKMKLGIDDVLARYPDSWNINNFAKFACLANDKLTTQLLFEKLKQSGIVYQAWDEETYNRCLSFTKGNSASPVFKDGI